MYHQRSDVGRQQCTYISKQTSFRRHADDSSTRLQCFINVVYHQWSNVARQQCTYISKQTSFRRHADDSSTRFQCFSNVVYHQWSDVARQQCTYISKRHPSDVMPTIVQLDSNVLTTSCTISGAMLRDNVAPTFPKTNKVPTSCRHKVSNQKPM